MGETPRINYTHRYSLSGNHHPRQQFWNNWTWMPIWSGLLWLYSNINNTHTFFPHLHHSVAGPPSTQRLSWTDRHQNVITHPPFFFVLILNQTLWFIYFHSSITKTWWSSSNDFLLGSVALIDFIGLELDPCNYAEARTPLFISPARHGEGEKVWEWIY